MKAWRITWKDKKGFLKSRYRTSQGDALTRVTRAKKEGSQVRLETVEIPTSRFALVDFLNSEMDSVDSESSI